LNGSFANLKINEIKISGNNKYNEFVYKKFLTVNVGDNFSENIKNKIIKDLFFSDYVNNVSVDFKNNILYINLEEKLFIKKITFKGNKKLKNDAIKENLKLKVKEVFSDNLLKKDLNFINEFYRFNGLFNTKVSYKVEYLENNLVEVIFNIEESKKAKVRSIYFMGNKIFSSALLKEKISTRENRLYRFFSKSVVYNSNMLDYDSYLLQNFYWSNGYLDFEVISVNGVYDEKENAFNVVFNIKEGEKFYFNKVNIINNVKSVNVEKLNDIIKGMKTDDPFSTTIVNEKINEITNILLDTDKFISVNPQIIPSKTSNKVDVNIVIDNYEHIYIGKITIKNNTKTHDSTIRQQLNIEEGSPFNVVDVERSVQKIRNLGFFKEVTYTKNEGIFKNQVDIVILVEEKSSGNLNFGISFSSVSGLSGNFGISQTNLFGRAINISFEFNMSKSVKNASFSFVKPNFMGTNIFAGVSVFLSEYDNKENKKLNIGYNQNSYGASTFLSFNLTEYLSQTIKYTYSISKLSDISEDYKNVLTDKTQKTSEISFIVSYDRRDNAYFTTRGYLLSYYFDIAGLIGTKDYIRNTAYFAYYYPVYSDRVVFKFETRLGHIKSLNNNPLYPSDGFYLGGQSMRGFESAGLGPRLETNNYGVGGTKLFYSNAEIKFPLLRPREFNLFGIFFINAGTVTGVEDNININKNLIVDSGSIRSAVGFSILWQTPMGNISVDFSKILKKEKYDLSQNFMFNIGKSF
jgi:outer membrane protein insertion porin family